MSGPLHRYTYADYTALEMISTDKHEFLDGEIYAMAGGSEEHSALAAAMVHALGNAVGDRRCRVHTSDLRIMSKRLAWRRFPIARWSAVRCNSTNPARRRRRSTRPFLSR